MSRKGRLGAGLKMRMNPAGFTLLEMMVSVGLLFIALAGVTAMAQEAINRNRDNYSMTMSTIAVLDRVSQLYRVPREYLEAKGVNTTFECDTDADPDTYDEVLLTPDSLVEDLDTFNGDPLPDGKVGYPFTFEMNVYGVCTPDRKDEQGLPRCVPDSSGKAFRGSCNAGQRQIGGAERNDRTANTYLIKYVMTSKASGAKNTGEVWITDDPSRLLMSGALP